MNVREAFYRQLAPPRVVKSDTLLYFVREDEGYRLVFDTCRVGDLEELSAEYEVEELAKTTAVPFLRRKLSLT
jgi:hypothetical protein